MANKMPSEIQKKLEAAEQAYLDQVEEIAAEAQEKIVIPFCDKYEIQLLVGNGTYLLTGKQKLHVWEDEIKDEVMGLTDERGRKIPGSKRVASILEERVSLMLSPFNSLGSFMTDYIPQKLEAPVPSPVKPEKND